MNSDKIEKVRKDYYTDKIKRFEDNLKNEIILKFSKLFLIKPMQN